MGIRLTKKASLVLCRIGMHKPGYILFIPTAKLQCVALGYECTICERCGDEIENKYCEKLPILYKR